MVSTQGEVALACIQQLDEKTINQIAAGEVVESPSSVLKELVENAVDAGAKHIRIEASSGGFHSLKIIDDGFGMGLEDLKLCLHRHATSKLRKIDDLMQVETLGFRGEALAAIAAVSRLKITTCLEGSKEAYQLLSDEVEVRINPAARSQGTTIEVSDLFYNVPARKSFQKSAGASSGELSRWVGYLALAYPHVGFSYFYQGKEVLSSIHQAQEKQTWSIEPWKLLCGKIFGERFAESGYAIDQTHQSWQLKGLLGHPHDHRPNRTGQIWIVNGRVVTIPQLSRAIQEGYGTRLPASRFPQFVLHLTLPGEWVDVNVHPQKRELRFKDSGMIGSWLAHAVGLKLARTSSQSEPLSSNRSSMPWERDRMTWVAESSKENPDFLKGSSFEASQERFESPLKSSFTPLKASSSWKEKHEAMQVSSSWEDVDKPPLSSLMPWEESEQSQGSSSKEREEVNEASLSSSAHEEKAKQSPFSIKTPAINKMQALSFDLHLSPLTIWKRWSLWRVEQLESKLEGWKEAVARGREDFDLVWMSGPRALARIRYEQAINHRSHVLSQALLVPIRLECHLGQMEKYQLLLPSLQACGFELRQVERLSFAIDAIPSGMEPDAVQEFFHQLLELESVAVKTLTKEKLALGLARQIERYESQVKIAPSELVLGLGSCHEKFISPLGRAIFRPVREEDFEMKSSKSGGER